MASLGRLLAPLSRSGVTAARLAETGPVSPRYASLASEAAKQFAAGNWLDVRRSEGQLTALLRIGDRHGRPEFAPLADALKPHGLALLENPADRSTFFVKTSQESVVGRQAFAVTVERANALAQQVVTRLQTQRWSNPALNAKGRATVDVDLGGTAFRGHEEIVALHTALQPHGFGIVHTLSTPTTPTKWSVSGRGVVKIEARPGGGPLVDKLNSALSQTGLSPRGPSWRDMFG